MGALAVGDVVVAAFPFSDLSRYKKRPAIVVAIGDFDDPVLCQITSFRDKAANTVRLDKKSFSSGSLSQISFARPDKLFTADKSLLEGKVIGRLSDAGMQAVKSRLKAIFNL